MSEARTIRACAGCGALQSYARPVCGVCRGRGFVQRSVPLAGTIYSMTVVSRAPSPRFADAVPYAIGLVRGPSGGLLMLQLQDFRATPAIGDPVSIEATADGFVARPPRPSAEGMPA
jgi:uncharacterized OB-fold protein